MPTPQIPKVSSDATLDELRDGIIGTHRYLTYLLSTLDTLNINRLDAKVVIAESITAGKLAADSVETKNLQAGAITTEKINAGAVTADKITVGQLSAIAADLGHITAGLIESIEIYGSYIATRRNAFPRAEINNTGDLLAVYTDASNSLKVEPGISNAPSITFTESGSLSAVLGPVFGSFGILSNGSITVGSSNGSLVLVCGGGFFDAVSVPSWSQFIRADSGVSLQSELDSLQTDLASKATSGISTGLSGSANGGIPIGTKLAVDGGGFVTWTGVPLHSHAQN